MFIKPPKPKKRKIVKNNKIVDKNYCSCYYLRSLGYPYFAIACGCGNPLTKPKN